MYSSIVVGIDGSETADIALGKAIDLARLAGATLHVVSAYEPAPARVSAALRPASSPQGRTSRRTRCFSARSTGPAVRTSR